MMLHAQLNKYICIIREENIDEGIPMYAKTKFSLHWTEPEVLEESFHQLLYLLFDVDEEPELGDIPTDIKQMLNKK